MNGIMNKNQLTIGKEYEFDKPLIHKIDSIIDKCCRDCHNSYFHTFKYRCIYNIFLQILEIMKKLIYQFLMKTWVCVN